jgi:hypothetical protein
VADIGNTPPTRTNGFDGLNRIWPASWPTIWLQENHREDGFISINHPSRSLDWSPGEIRDLHNAGPDVVIGMTAFPGHQKAAARGSYGAEIVKQNQDVSYKARTYGGADYMTAKVGGLWDALLGEGRLFYVGGVSDFHNTKIDFWPGEYAMMHVHVEDKNDPKALVKGLKSGRFFPVIGGLIDAREFTAETEDELAHMGGNLEVEAGESVTLTIRFHSPEVNHNGDPVAVDHIDLIAGDVTGLLEPGTHEYKRGETNPSTRVVESFSDWETDEAGYHLIVYEPHNLNNDMYFRLRGTNLGFNVPNETDAEGNPLCDDLMGVNTEEKAWADLWFYSNPIFVEVEDH